MEYPEKKLRLKPICCIVCPRGLSDENGNRLVAEIDVSKMYKEKACKFSRYS